METLPQTLHREESPETNLLREVALVIMRRRKLILGVYVGVLVGAVACIFMLAPQYRAAAKVLLTTNHADISTTSDRATELVRNDVNESEINSQLEILRSNDLIENVLTHLNVPLDAPPKPPTGLVGLIHTIATAPKNAMRAAYRGIHNLPDVEPSSPLYWAVRSTLEDLDAGPVRGSNVIEIGLTSPDPRWARDFVNALTTAYVDRQAHMESSTQAENFFTEQSDLLRKKLSDSESALHDLREKAGVLAGQQAEVHLRLNEFNAELARTKIARAEMEERVAFFEQMRTKGRRAGTIASPQLLELEGKRAELISRYREDSERVKDIDRQIRALKSAIASYDAVTAADDGQTSPAGMDVTASRASLAALKAKEEALARETTEYRRQAELLDAQNFDMVRLDRQQKLDEEAYLSYVRTAEEFRLSNALDQSKLLRLTVVELANLPMDPVSPRRGRILAFAIVGGLLVSIAAAFARELFDSTIKTPGDVRRHAKLEVLAMLPDRY